MLAAVKSMGLFSSAYHWWEWAVRSCPLLITVFFRKGSDVFDRVSVNAYAVLYVLL